MKKIHICQTELDFIRKALSGSFEILVFGSRLTGKQKPFSDLDLCLKSEFPIPGHEVSQIREKLEDSDLPYQVDIVLWQDVSPEFRKIIEATGERLENCEPSIRT